MATAKPVTDGQECVSLWRAGLLMSQPVWSKALTRLPDYNRACVEYNCTADEWAKWFAYVVQENRSPYYVLVEDDNEE